MFSPPSGVNKYTSSVWGRGEGEGEGEGGGGEGRGSTYIY